MNWKNIPEGKRKQRLKAFMNTSLNMMLYTFYEMASERDVLEITCTDLTDYLREPFAEDLDAHGIELLSFTPSISVESWESMPSPTLCKIRYAIANALRIPLVAKEPNFVQKVLGYEKGIDKFWHGDEEITWRPAVPDHAVTFDIAIRTPLTGEVVKTSLVVTRRCLITAVGAKNNG